MSLDGQVLVIAFFAVALKLFLWFREDDVVGVDIEPDRKHALPLTKRAAAPGASATRRS